MNFQSAGYQLLPVLPELVLAVGAMLLLMLGGLLASPHPYGTTAATSPWRTGLPSNAPSWCSLAR